MTAADPAAPTRSPRRSLWRHNDFMRLWGAQTVSLVGSQITLLAIPLAAILLFDATPMEVGLLAAAQYLPFLLVGLPAGVWVDRMPRRPTLIVADLGRAAVLLVIPIAYAGDWLQLWLLYPVAFGAGILTVFFDVAHQSYLPSLVRRDELVEGNAKLELSYQGAQLAGPGLGGWIVQVLTAPIALIVDAVSYLVSAILLLFIRQREAPAERTAGPRQGVLSLVGEGLRYVWSHDLLRPIALATALGNLFGVFGIVQAVLNLFAIRSLGLSPGLLGVTLAAANGGALLGALANRRLVGRFGVGPTLIGAAAFPAVGILLLAAATRDVALPVMIAGLAIAWFGIAAYNINQISLRQAVTPPHMQGRMNATMRFLIWGTIPVGTVLGGFFAGRAGLRETLVVAGAGSLLAVLPVLFSALRHVRMMPEPVQDAAAAMPEPADG